MDGETSQNPGAGTGSPAEENAGSITDIMGSMADKATPPEAKPSDTGDTDKGTSDKSATDEASAPAWTSQLNDEIRGNADQMKQLSKFQKISELAKSYTELESKLGNSLVKPGKDASPEELNAFYEKLGKPTSADGYSMIGEETKVFREVAYRNNLTKEQADAVYNELVAAGNKAVEYQQQQLAAQAAATEKAMREEYGAKYAEKLNLLKRGVMAYGGPELGQRLKETGLIYDPVFVKHFIHLGEQSAEAGTFNKSNPTGNGYKSTLEGGHFDFS